MSAVKKLIATLESEKDLESVRILRQIEGEETGHYEMGVKWFRKLCEVKKVSIE